MAKTETITMEIEADLKRDAELFCNNMGLTLSAFYTMLLKAIIRPDAKAANTTGNPMLSAVLQASHALHGAAEEAGFRNEEELQKYVKEVVRPEVLEEWNVARNA